MAEQMKCGVCDLPLALAEPRYVHADGHTYRHPIRPVPAVADAEQADRPARDEPQRCGLATHGGACDEPKAEGADRCAVHVVAAARQLFKAICREHERGETFPVRVSVCTNALREALGETYPDDSAGQADGGDRA